MLLSAASLKPMARISFRACTLSLNGLCVAAKPENRMSMSTSTFASNSAAIASRVRLRISGYLSAGRSSCIGCLKRSYAKSKCPLSTLKPLDLPTILESVARTGRCVIVHEAPRAVGVGAEIAAGLAEEGLETLLAPVERVTGWDTVMPFPRLEHHYMPSAARVAAAVHRTLAYG